MILGLDNYRVQQPDIRNAPNPTSYQSSSFKYASLYSEHVKDDCYKAYQYGSNGQHCMEVCVLFTWSKLHPKATKQSASNQYNRNPSQNLHYFPPVESVLNENINRILSKVFCSSASFVSKYLAPLSSSSVTISPSHHAPEARMFSAATVCPIESVPLICQLDTLVLSYCRWQHDKLSWQPHRG